MLLDSLRFEHSERPKLVHRIDKQTSGILLIARTLNSSKYYADLFKNRLIEKKYLAIVSGKIDKIKALFVGQQKGRNTKENIHRNFGMMRPEGYRKALRVMKLAEKFELPIVSLIDTPGAYPGIGAEERGQGEAIAKNIYEMSKLRVPIVSIVIGEGASGGALGIGVCDRMLMMENSWYSVISPEGCASILFRDASKAEEAAEALKVTPDDMVNIGVCDVVISEPNGGAHRDPKSSAKNLELALLKGLSEFSGIKTDMFIDKRIERYDAQGVFEDTK